MPKQKVVWVVMGNDFPDAVFATEALASQYVVQKKELDAKRVKEHYATIYWRSYAFTLQESLP